MMTGEIVVYSSMSKKLYTVLTKKPYVSDIGFFCLNNKTCTVFFVSANSVNPRGRIMVSTRMSSKIPHLFIIRERVRERERERERDPVPVSHG